MPPKMQPTRFTFKSILLSKITLTILFFLLIFFIYNIIGIIGKGYEAKQEKKRAQDKITQLQAQKNALEKKIDSINTDVGAETVLRDKFRIVKEHEGLIILTDEKPQEKPVPVTTRTKITNFFKKFFH